MPIEMSIDRWLALLGVIIGVLGIVLAYIFYRKTIRRKVLAIAYTDPIPLLMTLANISVTYQETTISALSRVYVLLWNLGRAPIEESDFIIPIGFKSADPILKFEIHDKDAAASAHLDFLTKTIVIDLLRPGEAITLVADVANDTYRPDLQIQMKSADMSSFIWGMRVVYPTIIGLAVGALLLILEFLILYRIAPPSSPSAEDLLNLSLSWFPLIMVGFIVAMGILPLGFGFLTGALLTKVVARSTTPVALNFFKLKWSALSIRMKFKEFRKFVDKAGLETAARH